MSHADENTVGCESSEVHEKRIASITHETDSDVENRALFVNEYLWAPDGRARQRQTCCATTVCVSFHKYGLALRLSRLVLSTQNRRIRISCLQLPLLPPLPTGLPLRM